MEYAIGFLLASIFSLAYYVVPSWLFTSMYMMLVHPFSAWTWIISAPVILSAIVPPIPMGWLLKTRIMQYIPMYFDYREVLETPHDELAKMSKERPTLMCLHPHGVFSMVSLCSATIWANKWWDPSTSPTAAADSVRQVPLLKHIIGSLGLTSASAKPLMKTLTDRKNGACILYPGGTSELFLSNPDHERLHLLDRKGFIKVALQTGSALVPGYLFGNTRVLRLLQWPILRYISRKTGFALTYLYGRFFLPMPLPEPCLCAIGRPIMCPKIESPTQEDIDKWHAIYVSELVKLFNRHKKDAPGYEHKELELQ